MNLTPRRQKQLMSHSFWRERTLPRIGNVLSEASFVAGCLNMAFTLSLANNPGQSGVYCAARFYCPLTMEEYSANCRSDDLSQGEIAEVVRKATAYALWSKRDDDTPIDT